MEYGLWIFCNHSKTQKSCNLHIHYLPFLHSTSICLMHLWFWYWNHDWIIRKTYAQRQRKKDDQNHKLFVGKGGINLTQINSQVQVPVLWIILLLRYNTWERLWLWTDWLYWSGGGLLYEEVCRLTLVFHGERTEGFWSMSNHIQGESTRYSDNRMTGENTYPQKPLVIWSWTKW